ALVEPLVALEPDEPAPGDVGERLRQFGLAHARGPLDEDGTAHARGEEDHGGDAAVGDVASALEALLDLLDRLEHGVSLEELAFIVASPLAFCEGPRGCETEDAMTPTADAARAPRAPR